MRKIHNDNTDAPPAPPPASAEVEPSCLTIAELCRRWKCTRKTVLLAVERGELAVFRIGRRAYRIRIAEVERYESTTGGRGAA